MDITLLVTCECAIFVAKSSAAGSGLFVVTHQIQAVATKHPLELYFTGLFVVTHQIQAVIFLLESDT